MAGHLRVTEEEFRSLPLAVCLKAPKGQYGLDGFKRGERYKYQLRPQTATTSYVRLWPEGTDRTYLLVCAEDVFRKFFTPR